jgi:hypothetical protein
MRQAPACAALRHWEAMALLVALSMIAWSPAARANDHEDLFESRIRPVLANVCHRCHNESKASGGLRVDSRAALVLGGDSGPAIVPGNAADSRLVHAVERSDDASAMPPDEPLDSGVVAAFATWIQQGAAWPERAGRIERGMHWSFLRPQAVSPPTVSDHSWVQTSVDAFIRARQEMAGVVPAPPADRRTLIRRLSYDLTGLPPTIAEVEAFEKDVSPTAVPELVERLLHSPRYGEHWGRHWLDLVRYADTAGENTDHPLPHAWRYRNWVVQAFNDNMPYDQFVQAQLAGDLLAAKVPDDQYADHVVATGYLAIARRFGHDIDQDMHLTIEDTIDTLGKSLLGLTLGCARCHDHKYDPLTAVDYYGLYGIFASTKFSFPGCEPKQQPRDLVPLVPPADTQRIVELPRDRRAREDVVPQQQVAASASNPSEQHSEKPPGAELIAVPVAFAVSEGVPANSKMHMRGDPTDLGQEVPRKFVDVLGGQHVSNTASSGRLELARWITARENPLAARIMANRVWQWHFGRGLVSTPNDFGTRGALPTHPELLDYLAIRLIESGWDLRVLHREILLSSTYQQSSTRTNDAATMPPELYASFARRRLAAEELRDSLLAVSGELDTTPGGAHPFPPEASWSFTQHNPFADEYPTFQRSVYLMHKRNRRERFFALFDGADPNASTPLRDVTTVPTQALFFLNDPFVHERSEKLAARVIAAADNDSARLEFAYQLLFGRSAGVEEQAEATMFFEQYAQEASGANQQQSQFAAWAAYGRVMLGSNEFLYVD